MLSGRPLAEASHLCIGTLPKPTRSESIVLESESSVITLYAWGQEVRPMHNVVQDDHFQGHLIAGSEHGIASTLGFGAKHRTYFLEIPAGEI